jgi:outer membrane lipoprotein SlyB
LVHFAPWIGAAWGALLGMGLGALLPWSLAQTAGVLLGGLLGWRLGSRINSSQGR